MFLAACAAGGDEQMGEAQSMEIDVAAPECYIADGTAEEAQARPSPLSQTEFSVGGHAGLLCYGAPSAKGRTVMGELVPWEDAWRAGANEPTTIHLTGPTSVGGVELEAGAYSLYVEPTESEWTFYLNSNSQRWGIPIDADIRASEVGSFTATPEPMDEMVETLQYRWEPSEDGTMGDMVFEWEHTRVKFHIHPGAESEG
jgi:Protein of unknown function (DUF2911)